MLTPGVLRLQEPGCYRDNLQVREVAGHEGRRTPAAVIGAPGRRPDWGPDGELPALTRPRQTRRRPRPSRKLDELNEVAAGVIQDRNRGSRRPCDLLNEPRSARLQL